MARTVYLADDGTEFKFYDDAVAHDLTQAEKLKERSLKNYTSFINGWNGERLLKEHSLLEYGVWQAFGEDSNCDLGGYHHMPSLGFFEGRLEDVIKRVVTLPGWYTWGGGGRIEKQTPPEVVKV